MSAAACSGKVADCAAGQAQSDKSNRGPDDDRGHKFVDPFSAFLPDDKGKYAVHSACEYAAENNSPPAVLSCADQRRDKRERASDEDRALFLGNPYVEQGCDTCAEKRGSGAHVDAVSRTKNRHENRGANDRQELLKRVHKRLFEGQLVFNVVNHLHK